MQKQKSVGSRSMQLSEEWVFQEEGASYAKALRWSKEASMMGESWGQVC